MDGTGYTLHLLLVEDSAVDAELIADELTKAAMRFELRRVEHEQAFRAALEEFRPDAILGDWTLPHFSGAAALEIARQRHPEVPFIFVAGTMPPAKAKDAMLHGAVDYVFKNDLGLLALTLTRAVDDAARRAEIARRLRQTEVQLQIVQMAEQLPEAAFLTGGLDLIEPLAGSGMAFLHFIDPDQENLELVAWSTRTRARCASEVLGHYPLSMAGIWADALRERRPAIINDYPEHARKKGLPAGHVPLMRALCVPVLADGLVQAIIGVGNKALDYDAADVETLNLLGGHLWRIAQRRRGMQALRESVERLHAVNEEIRLSQERLVQSGKLSAIGQLAAGIAHELYTPLAYVKSNLGSLRGYVDALLAIVDAYQRGADAQALAQSADLDYIKSDAAPLIEQTLQGIEKATGLVLDLKDFSRPEGAQEWREADLNQELDTALKLVWNELKYKCAVHKQYGALPPVRCLPNRLGQVFVNLLVNAGQAIADKGELTLRTGQADGAVRIEVSDDGAGIAAAVLPHIFEPFFTTKPKGVGTGLGLALSANIVAQHGGRIEVDSVPGQGTTVRIVLPLAPPGANRTTEGAAP